MARTALLLSALLTGAVSAAAESYTAFTDVNVLTMVDDRVLSGQTVVVRNQRIHVVGPAADVAIPKGAVTVDGGGRYLIPGLAEMHGHTPVPGGDPTTQFVKDMMFIYVANGVTTVRGMMGARGQLELRDLVQRGEMVGPALYLAGPGFSGNAVSSPDHARRMVIEQFNAGWDLLKVYPGLTRAEFDAMATTAHRLGIRFAGHVPEAVGLEHALRMGMHTFDHIDGFLQQLDFPNKPLDAAGVAHWANEMRRSGAWVVPTLLLWEHIIGLSDPDEMMGWPEMAYWPPREIDNWYRRQQRSHPSDPARLQSLEAYAAARRAVLKALNEAGAGILMGTDSPQVFSVPGFSIHREMAAMVAAGMTPAQVLASGTRNIGTYLQGRTAVGVVAPGNRADLILLAGNPLEDIGNTRLIEGVMANGQWLDKATIARRLAEIKARNAR